MINRAAHPPHAPLPSSYIKTDIISRIVQPQNFAALKDAAPLNLLSPLVQQSEVIIARAAN